MRWMRWSLCPLLVAVSGCADAVAPRLAPAPDAPRFYEEVDPEQFPVRIKSYYVTASLPETRSYGDAYGTGRIDAGMVYNAHHASIQVSSTLREHSGTVIQQNYPEEQRHTWGYFDNEHYKNYSFFTSSLCGGAIQAHAVFKAWFNSVNREWSIAPIQMDQKSDSDEKSQPQCAPCPEDTQNGLFASGGAEAEACYRDEDGEEPPRGGGGGGCVECVEEPAAPTYCRIRYWYWKDTGEVIDYAILWCA